MCSDDDKRRTLNKLLINIFKDNDLTLISNESLLNESEKVLISPWTLPSYDFTNLINQYNLYNMIVNGKRANKNNSKTIDIMKKDSWKEVNWDLFNTSISKNINLLFNNFMIDKINDYKNKVKLFKSNIFSNRFLFCMEIFISHIRR